MTLQVVDGVIGLILIYRAARPGSAPAWIGFFSIFEPEQGVAVEKTLWDWLELMRLPLSVVLGAWWIVRSRTKLSLGTIPKPTDGVGDSKIIVIALEERRVQDYIDRISDLLLTQGLRESTPNDVLYIAVVQK